MTNTTTTPKLGRPVNPNSARQQRIQELNEKREKGLCKRGRPVNGESKRQEVLKLREEKLKNGIELKRGRPVNPNSERQIRLSKKVVSE